MRLGILYSGGKDSTYALEKAREKNDVDCLITVVSGNPESYMFHTPNIDVTTLQAEALGLPLVKKSTGGVKEEELSDLEAAVKAAAQEHGIEGVVSGAVESVYQAERIQGVCARLGLWCHNPLWKMGQERLLRDILAGGYEVVVSGVFAYPMGEEWLGRRLDSRAVDELVALRDAHGISPAGEGGEIETTVLDAPFFRRRIDILDAQNDWRGDSGVYRITKARLAEK